MQLPSFKEVYRGLISTSSISSTDPSWDEGKVKVIEKLAVWLKDIGFEVTVTEVEKGKHNLIAKKAVAKVVYYSRGIAIPFHSIKAAGITIPTH